jgi:hypothetical protein
MVQVASNCEGLLARRVFDEGNTMLPMSAHGPTWWLFLDRDWSWWLLLLILCHKSLWNLDVAKDTNKLQQDLGYSEFIMENVIEMDDFGNPHSRKPPFSETMMLFTSCYAESGKEFHCKCQPKVWQLATFITVLPAQNTEGARPVKPHWNLATHGPGKQTLTHLNLRSVENMGKELETAASSHQSQELYGFPWATCIMYNYTCIYHMYTVDIWYMYISTYFCQLQSYSSGCLLYSFSRQIAYDIIKSQPGNGWAGESPLQLQSHLPPGM